MKNLVKFINGTYRAEHLSSPTADDMKRILDSNAQPGMPGCMGSLDYSHWDRRNFPKAYVGMYQVYKGRRTNVLETVCDEYLWVWHFFVGSAGSHNYTNMLEQSPLFSAVTGGYFSSSDMTYTVNVRTRSLLYHIVDGM